MQRNIEKRQTILSIIAKGILPEAIIRVYY